MSQFSSNHSRDAGRTITGLLLPLVFASALVTGAGAVEPLQPTAAGDGPGPGPGIIFGPDDRVASDDPRVGRLLIGGGGLCTAWLTSAGVALTAYHCRRDDSRRYELQFKVPRSSELGMRRNPAPRYSFYAVSVDDSGSSVPGNDWRVLRVSPNADGDSAFDVMGRVFRLHAVAPTVHDNVAVTGYGIDFTPPNRSGRPNCKTHVGRPTEACNAQSLTEQTDTGPVTGTNGTWVSYEVDTERAASGAPVFIPGTDTALAIHHGGSGSPCLRANCGTLLSAPRLEDAIAGAFKDGTARVVFVDSGGNHMDAEDTGGPYTPYRRLSEAIDKICEDGCPEDEVTLALAAGNYAGWSFTSPAGAHLKLIAPAGRVTIGAATPPYGNPSP